jgi:hypothetical protein
MDTDRVFIKDIAELREFIKLQRDKEDYFDHVMDRIMARKARARA